VGGKESIRIGVDLTGSMELVLWGKRHRNFSRNAAERDARTGGREERRDRGREGGGEGGLTSMMVLAE
jgi:hypothetical protein